MCIVLLTTSHPDYAIIIIDNRDEFILRPTSRPHWWQHANGRASVLSARDLQRAEKGTWLGITREGVLAVLTNYRETDVNDVSHPVHGTKSRGGMVTAWLGGDVGESAVDSVHHMVKDSGCKGVGGFSMVCGKLKIDKTESGERTIEPLAIISNRNDHIDDVPWIGGQRGGVYALSNTFYQDPKEWPKITNGRKLLAETIEAAISKNLSEEDLSAKLFDILNTDTLPRHKDMSLMDYVPELKISIFIPPIGDVAHRKAMTDANSRGKAAWATDDQRAAEELKQEERPGPPGTGNCVPDLLGFETGLYGTQRQTVLLVDWEGNVTYRERALWDGNGNALEKGSGEEVFRFKIDGWDSR
jgi:uncharacterized protein with NRDE domain